MAAPVDIVLGIDVAKAQLDVAVWPTGDTWTVPRSPAGLRRLQARVQALQPTRIVLEATRVRARRGGGRCRGCRWWWSIRAKPATSPAPTAPWPRPIGWTPRCWPASRPTCGRRSGPSPRRRSSTCGPWCGSAASWWSCGWPPSTGAARPGPARWPRRDAHLALLRSRAPRAGPGGGGRPAGRPPVAGPRRRPAEHPRHRARGRATLLAEVPELGTCTRQQVSRPGRRGALQPRQRRLAWAPQLLGRARSGPRRPVHGRPGRHAPQSPPADLLPALVAAGKPPKVALVACMRKLLVLCNALCQRQTMWDPAVT